MADKKLFKEITLTQKNVKSATAIQRAYRGISTVNNNNTKFALFDLALIKQDIINHFHISKGEKLENPDYGTIIWSVLHDPFTDSLKTAIIEDVNNIFDSDPRINADKVVVTPYESGLQIEVELTYLNYNISEKLRLNFDEANGLLN